jgi:hypothetical protein
MLSLDLELAPPFANFEISTNMTQDKVLLEGLEWSTGEAVDKLKKLLWGLEALRVFDDRLSASLGQVQKAQEAMERVAKQVCLFINDSNHNILTTFQDAGQQHVDLLQEYNNIIEEFEKRYNMLCDVHIATQLKISQITGLRDGVLNTQPTCVRGSC